MIRFRARPVERSGPPVAEGPSAPGPAAAERADAPATGLADASAPQRLGARPTAGPLGEAARAEPILGKLQLLVTRRLDGLLQGDYLGLLPGPGTEAGESREYRSGDDVRRMDWPVTARTTVPHVRQTVADRELETWIAMDLSASLDFGTATWLKRDLALAAAAAVAHLTVRGGNRIGAVIGTGESAGSAAVAHRSRWAGFAGIASRAGWAGSAGGAGRVDRVGSVGVAGSGGSAGVPGAAGSPRPAAGITRLPARPGRKDAQGLLRAIAKTPIQPGRTDLGALIDALNRPPRRRGLAVVISDFLAPPEQWARPVRKLAVRHDVLAIEIVDPRELELPDAGVMEFVDPETGTTHEVHTGDARLRAQYAASAAAQRAAIATALRGAGAAHLRLRTDSDWLLDIVRFVAAQRHARTRGTTR